MPCFAQEPEDDVIEASPKAPWGDIESAKKETPWYIDALLWVPNRVLDFIDILIDSYYLTIYNAK
jgi:hypothetical protein